MLDSTQPIARLVLEGEGAGGDFDQLQTHFAADRAAVEAPDPWER